MYQALCLIQGLKLYRDTGMKVNRSYTPTNMLALAGQMTGQRFKRGQFNDAIQAIEAWLEERKAEGEHIQTDKGPVMLERKS
jgi:hypothetical protein